MAVVIKVEDVKKSMKNRDYMSMCLICNRDKNHIDTESLSNKPSVPCSGCGRLIYYESWKK